MPTNCERCNKAFPIGQDRCNWCDPNSQEARQSRIAIPTEINIDIKGIFFWVSCVFAWIYLPLLIGIPDEFEKIVNNSSLGSIVYFVLVFLPEIIILSAIGVFSFILPLALAFSNNEKKVVRLGIFLVGVVLAFSIGYYYEYHDSEFQKGKLGDFTLTVTSRARDSYDSNQFLLEDASLGSFYTDEKMIHSWKLAWKGQPIGICDGKYGNCHVLSIHAIKNNPAWLIAVAQVEEEKTRVFLIKDAESRFSSQEIATLNANTTQAACYRIDKVFQHPFTDEITHIGHSLWFDKKTESILPICALQNIGDIGDSEPDSDTPLMVSPDRHWIAFMYRGGLVRLTNIPNMERLFSCYRLLPVSSADKSEHIENMPVPRIDWEQAVEWTEKGISFAPGYHAKLLLAPLTESSFPASEEDRAQECKSTSIGR